MTVFARKSMNVTQWAAVHEQIDSLQMALGAPHDLMMLGVRTDDRETDDIYIGLPDRKFLPIFPGFVEVDQAALPDRLSTLVVREDGFKERFPDIYKKRRSCLQK